MGLGGIFSRKKNKEESAKQREKGERSKRDKALEKEAKRAEKHNQKESKRHAKELSKRLSALQTAEVEPKQPTNNQTVTCLQSARSTGGSGVNSNSKNIDSVERLHSSGSLTEEV